MFIIGNLIIALANVLDISLTIYSLIVIISAVLSWVNPDPYNPVVRFLHSVTEPVFRPIRRLLPFRLPIDISPIIVLLIIYFLQIFLISSLIELGYRIKGGNI
ncbi:YggT family protein [Thermodesulfovibrio aggregans]|uniref:YggT family protein n=1 Tax=Thermodesulfovibrio aggregans TaxID=86166 RepID=A0A0U9HMZ0_9BACT|nr:YggT family protein [Thermodesulfovibrio aggregans]GAQ94363.1 YggT family protein [Thermodesulfovibrio aggregans]